jgi:MFS family permease
MPGAELANSALRRFLGAHPMATAVVYVITGVLTLYLISAQIGSLETDLGFNAARLGYATATYFGIGAVISPFAGRFIARRGPQSGLRAGCGFAAAAALVAAASTRWWLLPIATALAGSANSFMQVGSNMVLVRSAAFERQGISFGAKQGAIPMASTMAGILLPIVGLAVGWRFTFLVAAALALVASGFAPPIPETPVSPAPPAPSRRGRMPMALRWLAVGGACGGAAGNAVSLFVVPSAVDSGLTEVAAGTILAACSALVVAVRIGSGWLADRRRSPGHTEMAWLLGAGTVGCAALALASTAPLYVAAMPLAMMGAWGWPGLVYFTVTSTNPSDPARASGVVLAGNLTGTLVGPFIVGLLAERHLYGAAWAFCGSLAAIATVAMLVSSRAWRRTTA